MEKKDSDTIICIEKELDESTHLFDKINISSDQPCLEWPECCISRVPKKLRKISEEAYTPKLISIGPFHHGGNEFKDMEKQKVRCFTDFLKRTGKSMKDLLEIIKVDEEKISHCYSEEKISHCYSKDCILGSDDHFVKMILLDTIFIIELFLKVEDSNKKNQKRDEEEKAHSKGKKVEEEEEEEDEAVAKRKRKKGEEEEEEDYILRKPWLLNGIRYDLILLENQVPFFILEKLYMFALNIVSPSYNRGEEGSQEIVKQDAPNFLMLSRSFFELYDKHKDCIIDNKLKHFTDLLRYSLCSGLIMKPNNGHDLDSRICATKLEDAGLKFKVVGKNDRRLLLDIKFVTDPCLKTFPCFNSSWLLACLPCLKKFPRLKRMQPILEVPLIVIDDNTEVLFRNLIALEQCHYPLQPYICNYADLLDNLIDSEKDVDLLVEKKIIVNNVGSNQRVAELINRLCLEIVVHNESCYSDIGEDLNAYSENHWNRIMAGMKSKFFCDFWRGAATTFAIFFTLDQLWGLVRPFAINK
jgi:hypothetical protein